MDKVYWMIDWLPILKGSLGFSSRYLYVICHSFTLVLSCVFIIKYNYYKCSVINKLRALSVAIMWCNGWQPFFKAIMKVVGIR